MLLVISLSCHILLRFFTRIQRTSPFGLRVGALTFCASYAMPKSHLNSQYFRPLSFRSNAMVRPTILLEENEKETMILNNKVLVVLLMKSR